MKLKFIKRLTWIYILVLVLGSVLPINSGTILNNTYVVEVRSDYLIHALILMPLPLLLSLSIGTSSGLWARVIFLGLFIVIFCEGIQMLLPYRIFNINDLIANGVGAFMGLIPAVLVWRHFSRSDRLAQITRGKDLNATAGDEW